MVNVIDIAAIKENDHQIKSISTKTVLNLSASEQCMLGEAYESGRDDIPMNLILACHYYQMAAEQGDPNALFNLGVCYQQGSGVIRDVIKAKELYYMAAKQNHAMAKLIMGITYDSPN